MKVILIDDEPIATEVLKIILSSFPDINVVGSYTCALKALNEIHEVNPDVIFLDIEMGDINGLEFARRFVEAAESVQIVFTTAYSEYAVDAFEVNAIDYLLKPIQEKRLAKTLERLRKVTDQIKVGEDHGLNIHSFGQFEVFDCAGNPLMWRTQKSKELFAYLWSKQGRLVSRISIIENLFWDRDLDRAGTLLHTTVYQLRKNLEQRGHKNAIIYANENYKLNLPTTSDLEKIRSIINLGSYNQDDISTILSLYQGDFLEKEGYRWAIELQQAYRQMIFNVLKTYARQRLDEGSLCATLKLCLDRLYDIDSYSEEVVEMMIRYYGIGGNQIELNDFYDRHVDTIWREMELKPSDSIEKLYKIYN